MNLIKIDNKIINLDNVNYIVETDYKCDFVMNNGMRVKTSSNLDEIYEVLKSYTIGRKWENKNEKSSFQNKSKTKCIDWKIRAREILCS